jgi:hypothetical protein
VAAALATPPGARSVSADDDGNNRLSVTVSFGAGLNTAQPSTNTANFHVLPQTIHVRTGGVVNFVVAGFHQIFVYNPGKELGDVVVPAAGTFINDLADLYYQGLSPVGPPPAGLSNAMNRVEPVSFSEPGDYLVICNVRSHFLHGMFAFVHVGDDDDNSN